VPLVSAAAIIRSVWELAPDLRIQIEAVHRLSGFGAVIALKAYGTSTEGFAAEWRMIQLPVVEGDRVDDCEVFDEADLDSALARFDELNRPAPLENSATRTWLRMADAFNHRDLDGFLALTPADSRGEDRRKGLRASFDEIVPPDVLQAMFDANPSWRCETEPLAIRGRRFALIRNRYRDTAEAGQPITSELLTVIEVRDDGRMQHYVSFDPEDINDAFAELTARWIASGEVAHPEVIASACRLIEIVNGHDWDTFAARIAGAAYVNHRQLDLPGAENITDHMSSFQMLASLVPDYWVEPAEVLSQSAAGLVDYDVLRGTSTDGVAIEIPFVVLTLFDGGRVTRMEVFEADQRDLALARFEELNRPG
jgi:hypothetical protein